MKETWTVFDANAWDQYWGIDGNNEENGWNGRDEWQRKEDSETG